MATYETSVDRTELMRKLIWLTRRHFCNTDALLEQLDLGRGQVPVLMELGRHGELNQRALAEHMRVTPATISGTLKRMERAGFVTRVTTDADARVSMVRLTELGQSLRGEARAVMDQTSAELLEELTEEECVFLRDILKKLERNIHTERKDDKSEE